jgi:RNase adapter protein RapZ
MTDILVITGLSGAGRSQAAADLEDLGWFVVDNLPTSLIEKVVELASTSELAGAGLALVVGRVLHQTAILDEVTKLRAAGHRVRILYLDAATPELVRRYGATKRRHPLGGDGMTLVGAVERERELLEVVKEAADLVIDTSALTIHQLKTRMAESFATDAPSASMQTTIQSFGYKHGLPLDVDMVFDCRFLPNPFWVEGLREQTGQDAPVREYVLGQEVAGPFLDKVEELLVSLLPAYVAEGKSYLTVAIGCTGGRHRSVAVAEELARRLRRHGSTPQVSHRDLPRQG